MNGTMMKQFLLTASALLTVSCAGAFNGPEHAMTVAEEHPISVDSQVVTLTIDVDPTVTELKDVDKARVRAFADAYLREGHGPLTVTAPSGASQDRDGEELAADTRKALYNAGVPWSALTGASYRRGGDDGSQLILSYTHYVATPSECGIWTGVRNRDYRNLRSPNYGCAIMNNVASMVADPHDLIAPADVSPRDATAAVRSVNAYRAGDVTSSETDNDIDASLSE